MWFDTERLAALLKIATVLETHVLPKLYVEHKVAVYLAILRSQMLERIAVSGTGDIPVGELKLADSEDCIIPVCNDSGGLGFGIVDGTHIGHVDHQDLISVWKRGMPCISQTHVAVEQCLIDDRLHHKHDASPAKTKKWENCCSGDHSPAARRDPAGEECSDDAENGASRGSDDEADDGPEEEYEDYPHCSFTLGGGCGRKPGPGFVACLCARILPDGTVTVANAGHLSPYDKAGETPVESGLPLGIAPGIEYGETVVRLLPGETLTFLSVGIVEARNPAGELFGFERTQEVHGMPAAQIAQAAKEFGQEDDIIVLKVRFVA